MIIFKSVDGKRVQEEYRCDYCGSIIDSSLGRPPLYNFDYSGVDSCMGSSNPEFSLVSKVGLDALWAPYVFCSNWTDPQGQPEEPCEILLINEVLTNDYFKWVESFVDAWRLSRVRVIERLLADKLIFPEDLPLP